MFDVAINITSLCKTRTISKNKWTKTRKIHSLLRLLCADHAVFQCLNVYREMAQINREQGLQRLSSLCLPNGQFSLGSNWHSWHLSLDSNCRAHLGTVGWDLFQAHSEH